jgi:hypothetical protein
LLGLVHDLAGAGRYCKRNGSTIVLCRRAFDAADRMEHQVLDWMTRLL